MRITFPTSGNGRPCLLALATLFLTAIGYAQEEVEFGQLTEFEKKFSTYEGDPEASAVVLYEKGNFFYAAHKDRLYLLKKYHVKIKILKESGFSHGEIAIPLLVTSEAHEDVADIRAITHNNGRKSKLSKEQIFPSNTQAGVLELKFAFPEVRVGSILEYQYTLLSPFFSNLEGWQFQSTIPKVYSEFNANIPYNLKYNRSLIGDLEFCYSDASFEECFLKLGNSYVFLCENLTYAMENIPAFKLDEAYMLGASNYLSRVDFELSKIIEHLKDQEYTTSWEQVDRQFRKDKDVGKQLRYKGFFGRQIPDDLLQGSDELTIAKNIYYFVRDHYTWNEGFGIYGQARVKEAFDKKEGNVAEINMSLINLLNAAGLKADLMLASTRDMGLPKKTYPTMSDFNYVLAKVHANGKDYILDATGKHNPFGILPYRALNHYGRVMDFSALSYWYPIKPYDNNDFHVRGVLKVDPAAQMARGTMETTRTGYGAAEYHLQKSALSEDDYMNVLFRRLAPETEVQDYEDRTNPADDTVVQERFQIETAGKVRGSRIYVNPFLVRFFEKDPFPAKSRKYPIDFGFPQDFKYQMLIEIPEGYKVSSIPEDQVTRLGDNLAQLKFFSASNDRQVTVNFELNIAKPFFEAGDYELLQELFRQGMAAQNNSVVVLEEKASR